MSLSTSPSYEPGAGDAQDALNATDVPDATAPPRAVASETEARRWTFALWGVPAGVFGFAAALVAPRTPFPGESTPELVGELSSAGFHLAFVLGIAALACTAFLAAGWRRWAAAQAPDSLAAHVVVTALTGTVGAMTLGYGFLGSLAIYLPGGMDAGTYPLEGLFSVYMFVDFAPFIPWWGVTVAGAAMVVLALRERLLPRWVGVVILPFVLAPVVIGGATALPGFPGVVGPLQLAITGLALWRSRSGTPA